MSGKKDIEVPPGADLPSNIREALGKAPVGMTFDSDGPTSSKLKPVTNPEHQGVVERVLQGFDFEIHDKDAEEEAKKFGAQLGTE